DLQVEESGHTTFRTLQEVFPTDSTVFMVGNPHYGAQGKVLEVLPEEVRVRIVLHVTEEPDFRNIEQSVSTNSPNPRGRYLNSYQAAQQIGIDSHILSRITGSVFVEKTGSHGARVNIGLNLKFTKKGEEVPGYTRKEENGWCYSYKCVKTVEEYITRFPDLWLRVQKQNSNTDNFTEEALFPEGSSTKLADVLKFLEELPCTKVPRMKTGSEILDEEHVELIEKMTAVLNPKPDIVKVKVKPRLLFRPLPNQGCLVPDPGTDFRLYDRVVVVKSGYSVPFGRRGTIIGIPSEEDGGVTPNSLYDVVFDEAFAGGITLRCSPGKGYRVPGSAMLNLTYGEFRKGQPNTGGRLPLRFVFPSGSSTTDFCVFCYTIILVEYASRHHHHLSFLQGYGRGGGSAQPKFVTPKVQGPAAGLSNRGYQVCQFVTCFIRFVQNRETENSEFNNMWRNLLTHQVWCSFFFFSLKCFMIPVCYVALFTIFYVLLFAIFHVPLFFCVSCSIVRCLLSSIVCYLPCSNVFCVSCSIVFYLPSSIADLALKQLLKIGVEPSTIASLSSASPTATSAAMTHLMGAVQVSHIEETRDHSDAPVPTYGRHLSLQELFEEANKHQQNQGVKIQQMQQQQQQQSTLSAAARSSENRDTMMELEAYCKNTLNIGPPQYDYKPQPKQNAYIANVLLPNGQRYEGSQCRTKEEAAKSAAGMAILCLNARPNTSHPLTVGYPPGSQRSNANRFFSANSAFSPIVIPGTAPSALPLRPPVSAPMLLTPQHFINQPPPPLSVHQLLQQQKLQHLHHQQHQYSQQSGGQHVVSYGPEHLQRQNLQRDSQVPQPHPVQAPACQSPTSGLSDQAVLAVTSSASVIQQFIPLQVSRNQKMPSKRKDSESERSDGGMSSGSDTKCQNLDDFVTQLPSAESAILSRRLDQQTAAPKNKKDKNGVVLQSSSIQSGTLSSSSSVSSKSVTPTEKSGHGYQKKKTRLAANFGTKRS
ncbi:unnamed protein product, partial [Candidula unifasciata]